MVACETCFNPAEAMPTATTCFVQLRRGSHDSHACQTLLDLLICLFFPETASTATPTFKVEEFAGKPAGGGAGTNHKPGNNEYVWEDTSRGSQIFQRQAGG